MADTRQRTIPLDRPPRPVQPRAVGVALAALIVGAAWVTANHGARQAALFGVGAACGFVLYHAAFGFTTAFRLLVTAGDGRGLRAQMLMFAIATVLFAPLLAAGEVFGTPVGPALAPVGVSVLVGAFVFGAGMQVGGG